MELTTVTRRITVQLTELVLVDDCCCCCEAVVVLPEASAFETVAETGTCATFICQRKKHSRVQTSAKEYALMKC